MSLPSLLLLASAIDDYDRHINRTRHYLQRHQLTATHQSPWRALFFASVHDDSGLLNVTGLNRTAFMALYRDFEPTWRQCQPRHYGRSTSMTTVEVLGMVLHWVTSRLGQKHLCEVFAQPPATVCRLLNKGLSVLLSVIRRHPAAAIVWPTAGRMKEFADAITAYEPGLHNIFGYVDGV